MKNHSTAFRARTLSSRASRRARAMGFALTELLLALVVTAALFGGGFLIYRNLSSDTEATRQTQGIIDLLSKSKETFGLVGGDWTQFTAANLIKMNRIPLQFTKDTTTIYDAFKNPVVFGAASTISGTTSFTARSSQECVQIAQRIADLTYTLAVGTSGSESTVKTTTTPLDIANLATGCGVAAPVIKVTMR